MAAADVKESKDLQGFESLGMPPQIQIDQPGLRGSVLNVALKH